jgi:hypothetical protein
MRRPELKKLDKAPVFCMKRPELKKLDKAPVCLRRPELK